MIGYREAASRALREALERDDRVLLIGQDIGARGGSHGVTAGLLEAFGPARVRDAPSSEVALVGVAVGAALAGLRPVVELTTAAFAALAFDQLLHHAAPLRALSGGRLAAPLVVRMPQGGGARLGPIHSQTLEALLHHVPGLVVATPATAADAHGLLAAAIASEDPVVVLEHAALYDTRGPLEEVAPPGHAAIRRAGTDVTLVGSSRMALVAAEAAERLAGDGVAAEVIDLRGVRPLDAATVLASARRTRRVVLVEEGWPAGGVGATLAARIAVEAPGVRIARVTGADLPAPYAASLERLTLPDAAGVVDAALRLLGPRGAATDHTMSAEIDMEFLRRSGTSVADAIAPLVADAALVLPDGTVTLVGQPPTNPTTITLGPATTRPSVEAGAVTVRRLAPLTLRIAAEPADAEAIFAALVARLEGEGAA